MSPRTWYHTMGPNTWYHTMGHSTFGTAFSSLAIALIVILCVGMLSAAVIADKRNKGIMSTLAFGASKALSAIGGLVGRREHT